MVIDSIESNPIIDFIDALPNLRAVPDLLNDLHMFNPLNWSWINLSPFQSGASPPARMGHGFASFGRNLYVHGGYDTYPRVLNDLYVLDPETVSWTDLTLRSLGSAPTPRRYHGFIALAGNLYVHGGEDENGTYQNTCNHFRDSEIRKISNCNNVGLCRDDLYGFDIATETWINLSEKALGSIPPPRSNHGFTTDGFMLYVQGGIKIDGIFRKL